MHVCLFVCVHVCVCMCLVFVFVPVFVYILGKGKRLIPCCHGRRRESGLVPPMVGADLSIVESAGLSYHFDCDADAFYVDSHRVNLIHLFLGLSSIRRISLGDVLA